MKFRTEYWVSCFKVRRNAVKWGPYQKIEEANQVAANFLSEGLNVLIEPTEVAVMARDDGEGWKGEN